MCSWAISRPKQQRVALSLCSSLPIAGVQWEGCVRRFVHRGGSLWMHWCHDQYSHCLRCLSSSSQSLWGIRYCIDQKHEHFSQTKQVKVPNRILQPRPLDSLPPYGCHSGIDRPLWQRPSIVSQASGGLLRPSEVRHAQVRSSGFAWNTLRLILAGSWVRAPALHCFSQGQISIGLEFLSTGSAFPVDWDFSPTAVGAIIPPFQVPERTLIAEEHRGFLKSRRQAEQPITDQALYLPRLQLLRNLSESALRLAVDRIRTDLRQAPNSRSIRHRLHLQRCVGLLQLRVPA